MKSEDITINDKSRIRLGHIALIAMILSIMIWGFGLGTADPRQLGNTGNLYRIILVLFAAVAGLFSLLYNGSRLSQAVTGPILLLLIYGLVAIVSSQYIPAYSLYSMWKAFEVIVDVIVAAAILSYVRPQDGAWLAYRVIIAIFSTMIFIYWIEAVTMPSLAFLPSRGYIPFTMQGVLPVENGNGLAFLGAVVAFSSLCAALQPRKATGKLWALLFAGLALVTLILAQSRTSLIGFAAAFGVYLFFSKRFGLATLVAAVVAVGLGFTQLSDVAEQYVVRGQSTELFTSLSGRTHAWEGAWKLFLQSPILGNGFAAAARVEILGITGASTLHGSVFDVLVGVGLLGLIPWAIAIVWTAIRLFRLNYSRHPWLQTPICRSRQAEMMGILALILIRSSTSSGLAMHEHTFILFMIVAVYASAVASAIKKKPVRQ